MDALAASVGGIGIAPGANINYVTGHAIFEATHGTAPKYAGLDKVNPSSVILSGCMMLEHLGWDEASKLIYKGIENSIAKKRVTYDFERLMEGLRLMASAGPSPCDPYRHSLAMRPPQKVRPFCFFNYLYYYINSWKRRFALKSTYVLHLDTRFF